MRDMPRMFKWFDVMTTKVCPSGRYPWGSGKNPFQHSGDFISRVSSLKKEGLTESKIAEAIKQQLSEFYGENTHFTTGDLRVYLSIAKAEQDIMMRDMEEYTLSYSKGKEQDHES